VSAWAQCVSASSGDCLSNGQNYAVVCPNLTYLWRHLWTVLLQRAVLGCLTALWVWQSGPRQVISGGVSHFVNSKSRWVVVWSVTSSADSSATADTVADSASSTAWRGDSRCHGQGHVTSPRQQGIHRVCTILRVCATILYLYAYVYFVFWVFLCSFFPSVLWYCWLGLLTCKNRLPYNLYCVGGDVKPCTIQSNPLVSVELKTICYGTSRAIQGHLSLIIG